MSGSGTYGDGVPFGDPYWYAAGDEGEGGLAAHSPHYTDAHRAFRAKVRAFCERELKPFVAEWDERGDYPADLPRRAYEAGVLSPMWPERYGGTPPPGGFDAFMDLVWIDELCRAGAGGVLTSAFFLPTMALPPVLDFGSEELRARVVPEVVRGRKAIALAVTEPTGGSDVAAVRTTARLEPDGSHYVVSGAKKFITAGTKASWFTTAVRTGGEGVGGISLLLIDRALPGVSVRRLPTTGWWTSGTTLVTFDKVRVPAACLLGREGHGFGVIMRNFNHERFVGCVGSNRYARLCLEQSVAFARQRRTFGRRLIDHQAIRHKIAEMAMRVESTHALIEQIAYRMQNKAPARELGGQLALCKVLSTRTMSYCANQAGQVFGGNAFVRGGKGAVVERVYREVRVNAVGGGSEEILLDLVGRMSKL